MVVTDHNTSASDSTSTFSVANVAPTFEAGLNATLAPAVAGAFSRTGIQITDPGSPVTFAGTVNFGDGPALPLTINQTTRQFDLSHTYASAGLFTVTVNLNDGDGGSASDSFTVDVTLNNPPVVAANAASLTVNEGSTATNTGTFSDAQGNSTVTLTSTVGGQAFGTVTKNDANGTWSWSYTPAEEAAAQTVTITATDSAGATASTTFSLTVNDAPLSNVVNVPFTATEGIPFFGTVASFTDTDPGTASDPTTDPADYSAMITWGDGTSSPGTIAYANTPGNFTVNATGTPHTYAEEGTKTGFFVTIYHGSLAPVSTGGIANTPAFTYPTRNLRPACAVHQRDTLCDDGRRLRS